MTGFIRGLFSGNGKKKAPQPPTPQEQNAYFLEPDDARTYGNFDYMRSSKTVKRTFARKKGVSVELESIRKISAMENVRFREDGTLEATTQPNGAAPKQSEANSSRRQLDTSLDMFRNMAKDMKK